MDFIFISDLKLPTRVGVYDWERCREQPILLNLKIGLPSTKAFSSDSLADALDYAQVMLRVEQLLREQSFNLLERLAEEIANTIRVEFQSPWVKVRVAKIAPTRDVKNVGVCIERGALVQSAE